jgi:hypothetical protein
MNIHDKNWHEVQVDHINHITHDNRRSNLRLVTSSQNRMNQKVRSDNALSIKGITKRSECNRYEVHISKDGHDHYLGLYPTLEEAIAVRRRAEEELFQEYAYVA